MSKVKKNFFSLNKLYFFFATGFGSGLSKLAPGTVGTLWAWVIFLVLDDFFNTQVLLIFIIILFFLGIFVSTEVEKNLKKKDPSEIVIDEMVAFWFILFFLPSFNDQIIPILIFEIPNWGFQFLAFVIFRALDIFKPWPISYFEKNYSSGFGIMIDDLVAAILTLFCIAIILKISIMVF